MKPQGVPIDVTLDALRYAVVFLLCDRMLDVQPPVAAVIAETLPAAFERTDFADAPDAFARRRAMMAEVLQGIAAEALALSQAAR